MGKESKILEIMHRLGLAILENGLLTFAILEELYNYAYQKGQEEREEDTSTD